MNKTENNIVWEAPKLVIELVGSTTSGITTTTTENYGSWYYGLS